MGRLNAPALEFETFVASLVDFGIEVRSVQETDRVEQGVGRMRIELARGSSAQQFVLLIGERVSLASVTAHATNSPTMVFAGFLATKTADVLRSVGIQFLDASGNAWISFGDVLVDIRGRRRESKLASQSSRATNLFSAARAQVVFALLAWPELWERPRRELADVAGVSVGQTHNTLALLADAGYDAAQVDPTRADLLDLWAAAFPSGLAQRIELATYTAGSTSLDTDSAIGTVYLSGETAVETIARSSFLVLYVEEVPAQMVLANRWRTDGTPNVFLRRVFWTPPGPIADASTEQTAPWPLVYADLLASDDARGREAAVALRAQHE